MTIEQSDGQLPFPGLAFMINERMQQEEKGYTRDHDIAQGPELLRAAACYIDWAACEEEGTNDPNEPTHPFWPWDADKWNPGSSVAAMLKGSAMVAAYYDANYT